MKKLNMKKTIAFLLALTEQQRTNAKGTVLGISIHDGVITINDGLATHTFTAGQGEEVQTLLLANGIELPEDCFKVPFYKNVTLIEVGLGVVAATAVGVTLYKLFGAEGVTAAASVAADAATSAGEAVATV